MGYRRTRGVGLVRMDMCHTKIEQGGLRGKEMGKDGGGKKSEVDTEKRIGDRCGVHNNGNRMGISLDREMDIPGHI